MIVPRLDHLVLATRDLEGTVDRVAGSLGVRPAPGGQHPGVGTRNFLLSLGGGSYVEVIGPDPDQPAPSEPRPFGIDGLDRPRLITWGARSNDLEQDAAAAAGHGHDLGPIRKMSRASPTGELLTWRLTRFPGPGVAVIPFLIDWGQTTHPSTTAPGGVTLVSFRAEHPNPGYVRTVLDAMALRLEVTAGPEPRLHARLSGPGGALDLD